MWVLRDRQLLIVLLTLPKFSISHVLAFGWKPLFLRRVISIMTWPFYFLLFFPIQSMLIIFIFISAMVLHSWDLFYFSSQNSLFLCIICSPVLLMLENTDCFHHKCCQRYEIKFYLATSLVMSILWFHKFDCQLLIVYVVFLNKQ